MIPALAGEVVAGDVLRVGRSNRRVRKVTHVNGDFMIWWEDDLDHDTSHTLCAPDRIFDLVHSEP